MGNEVSTIGGAVATAGTAIAAGVTFGQFDSVNKACGSCAAFTADKASQTIVRHAGETAVTSVALVATSTAAVVTFGQIDAVNKAALECAIACASASANLQSAALELADNSSDSVPIIAHVKGGVCYAVGATERGHRAMIGGTRTLAVMGSGALGMAAGPGGAIVAGVAAGVAFDGAHSMAGDRPAGQIAAWSQVTQGANSNERLEGLIGIVACPVMDGALGLAGGKLKLRAARVRGKAAREAPNPKPLRLRSHNKAYLSQGVRGVKRIRIRIVEGVGGSLAVAFVTGGGTHTGSDTDEDKTARHNAAVQNVAGTKTLPWKVAGMVAVGASVIAACVAAMLKVVQQGEPIAMCAVEEPEDATAKSAIKNNAAVLDAVRADLVRNEQQCRSTLAGMTDAQLLNEANSILSRFDRNRTTM